MSAVSDRARPFQLAHEPPFALGHLTVLPATREVRRDDGAIEVIEPRVMQVLVALVRAHGQVVSRNDLTQSCWEGRVVGEDAINRVMSRLRHLARGLGDGAFRVETVTKVGYRLITENGATGARPGATPTSPLPLARRRLLVGGALVAGVAAAGIGAWRLFPHRPPPPPPPPPPLAARLMRQAQLALSQGGREGQNQAIGLLRRIVVEEPGDADSWGALAMVYAYSARQHSTAESNMLRARARAAAERAEAIDPNNGYAAVARAVIVPARGNWLRTERALRRAIATHPDHHWPPFALGQVYHNVGRYRESAAIFERLLKHREPDPALYFNAILATWSANRLEEADRLIEEASQLYPSQFAIWFARLYVQMYTGRAAASLAMIEDVAGRPTGIPAADFAAIATVIRAMLSRAASDIDEAMRLWLARARAGSGYGENAVQFASALGRSDDAFALLDAYYFNRGFVIPEVRFTVEQGDYSPLAERQTAFLFWPSMAPVRHDPRFATLTRDLGLDLYWRESGHPADDRHATSPTDGQRSAAHRGEP